MLLCDPISLLIFILINLSARVNIVNYRKLVLFVFNLVYTQNVLVLMTQLNEEQRKKILNVSISLF